MTITQTDRIHEVWQRRTPNPNQQNKYTYFAFNSFLNELTGFVNSSLLKQIRILYSSKVFQPRSKPANNVNLKTQDYWLLFEKKGEKLYIFQIKNQPCILHKDKFPWGNTEKIQTCEVFTCNLYLSAPTLSTDEECYIDVIWSLRKASAACLQRSSLDDDYSILFSEREEWTALPSPSRCVLSRMSTWPDYIYFSCRKIVGFVPHWCCVCA